VNPDNTIADLITRDPVTIERDKPLSEAYRLLRAAPFHHVPVVDRDKPIGIISSVDVLRLAYDIEGFEDRDMADMLDYQFNLDDAMSTDLRMVTDDSTIRQAAAQLADGQVHSLLVIDNDGSLTGIVTTTDLLRRLADE